MGQESYPGEDERGYFIYTHSEGRFFFQAPVTSTMIPVNELASHFGVISNATDSVSLFYTGVWMLFGLKGQPVSLRYGPNPVKKKKWFLYIKCTSHLSADCINTRAGCISYLLPILLSQMFPFA